MRDLSCYLLFGPHTGPRFSQLLRDSAEVVCTVSEAIAAEVWPWLGDAGSGPYAGARHVRQRALRKHLGQRLTIDLGLMASCNSLFCAKWQDASCSAGRQSVQVCGAASCCVSRTWSTCVRPFSFVQAKLPRFPFLFPHPRDIFRFLSTDGNSSQEKPCKVCVKYPFMQPLCVPRRLGALVSSTLLTLFDNMIVQ